jgi:hypothetical protein
MAIAIAAAPPPPCLAGAAAEIHYGPGEDLEGNRRAGATDE